MKIRGMECERQRKEQPKHIQTYHINEYICVRYNDVHTHPYASFILLWISDSGIFSNSAALEPVINALEKARYTSPSKRFVVSGTHRVASANALKSERIFFMMQ